jgi:hypothetical protein
LGADRREYAEAPHTSTRRPIDRAGAGFSRRAWPRRRPAASVFLGALFLHGFISLLAGAFKDQTGL